MKDRSVHTAAFLCGILTQLPARRTAQNPHDIYSFFHIIHFGGKECQRLPHRNNTRFFAKRDIESSFVRLRRLFSVCDPAFGLDICNRILDCTLGRCQPLIPFVGYHSVKHQASAFRCIFTSRVRPSAGFPAFLGTAHTRPSRCTPGTRPLLQSISSRRCVMPRSAAFSFGVTNSMLTAPVTRYRNPYTSYWRTVPNFEQEYLALQNYLTAFPKNDNEVKTHFVEAIRL